MNLKHATESILFFNFLKLIMVAQPVQSLPAVQGPRGQSRGREDPLEKEMATHSSILAWKIPWVEEPGRLQSMESQRVRHDWATSLSLFLSLLNPLAKSAVMSCSPAAAHGEVLL